MSVSFWTGEFETVYTRKWIYMQRHVTEWVKFLLIRTQAIGASYNNMDFAQVAIHVCTLFAIKGLFTGTWVQLPNPVQGSKLTY